MATPLAQWLFTEASSGTTPTSVADTSSGTAVPLVPAYQGATAWTSTGAGKGLSLAGTNSNATSATLGTNKIQTGLNGSKTMTWELVIDFGTTGAGGATIADVLDNATTQVCGLYSTGSGAGWQVWSDFADATQNFSLSKPSSGVHVVHIVFDSTQATAGNRVKVYFDGVSQTLTAGTTIPQNRTLAVASAARATIGSFPGDNFSWSGGIYYAALYVAALSSVEVTANATALAANNDADPNAGSVTPANVGFKAAQLPALFAPPPGFAAMPNYGAGLRLAAPVVSLFQARSLGAPTQPLTASLTCSASLTAALGGVGALAASCSGGATVSATFSAKGALVAACTTGASLTATVGGIGGIAAALAAGASLSATAGGIGNLGAALGGGASLTAGPGGLGSLAAICAAGAGLTGTLVNGAQQSASLAGGATCSGTLGGVAAAVTSLAAGAVVTGTLGGVGLVGAALSAGASCSATIAGTGSLTASLSAGATCAGTATGKGSLAASLACSGSVSGNLTPVGFQSAGLSGGATCSGTLTAFGSLATALGAGATAAGTLGATAAAGASLTAGASCSGTLAAVGSNLAAALAVGAGLTVTIGARGAMQASLGAGAACSAASVPTMVANCTAGASLTGTLIGPPPPPFTPASVRFRAPIHDVRASRYTARPRDTRARSESELEAA